MEEAMQMKLHYIQYEMPFLKQLNTFLINNYDKIS